MIGLSDRLNPTCVLTERGERGTDSTLEAFSNFFSFAYLYCYASAWRRDAKAAGFGSFRDKLKLLSVCC